MFKGKFAFPAAALALAAFTAPIAAISHSAVPQIPERFHGVWDDVASDCSANSDALLRISASGLSFYESTNTITSVETDGDRIIVSALSSGEGESWESAYELTVNDDRLLVKVVGSQWGPFERKRCK